MYIFIIYIIDNSGFILPYIQGTTVFVDWVWITFCGTWTSAIIVTLYIWYISIHINYIRKCTYPHHEIISEIVGCFNEGISDIWERRFFVCSFKFALGFSTKLHREIYSIDWRLQYCDKILFYHKSKSFNWRSWIYTLIACHNEEN